MFTDAILTGALTLATTRDLTIPANLKSRTERGKYGNHILYALTYIIRERLSTHKIFTKDQCFYLIIISSP